MGSEIGTPAARRRKLFALSDQIGLDRDERLEFSKALLWRDLTSWSNLDDRQVDRLLDALEGYAFINWVITNRVAPSSGSRKAFLPAPDPR